MLQSNKNYIKNGLEPDLVYRIFGHSYYQLEIPLGGNSVEGSIVFAENINENGLWDNNLQLIRFILMVENGFSIIKLFFQDKLIYEGSLYSFHFNIEIHKAINDDSIIVIFFDDEEVLFTRILVQTPNKFRVLNNENSFNNDIRIFQIESSKNFNTHQLKIGASTIRFGNIFDDILKKVSDLIVVPISESGTVSKHTAFILNELNIRTPKKNKFGEITQIRMVRNVLKPRLIFACSVKDGERTQIERIKNLLFDIFRFSLKNNVSKISLPMLGTGAGNLSVKEFFSVFFENIHEFESRNISFILNILGPDNWKEVVNFLQNDGVLFQLQESTKPSEIRNLEIKIKQTILQEDYTLDLNGNLISFKISNISEDDIKDFRSQHLNKLYIQSSELSNLEFLNNLPNLEFLELKECYLFPMNLSKFQNLCELEIIRCNLPDIDFLSNIPNIKKLILKRNNLTGKLAFPILHNLIHLDVSHNNLLDLDISLLSKLSVLDISHNEILSIEFLRFKKLFSLDISNNNVQDFEPLKECPLQFLKANNNPYVNDLEIFLDPFEDHLNTVLNIIKRQEDSNKREVTLPAKVMLLGNHGSGKSSLLYYLKNGSYAHKLESTHIINVESKPATVEGQPWAIFYDFGGQDYYHGLYNAFLSGGAIYVLLWQSDTNKNQKRIDSKNLPTHDFSLDYWLAQKRYIEQQRYFGESDPLFLIQSHSVGNKSILPCRIANDDNFVGDFSISLQPVQDKQLERLNLSSIRYLDDTLSYYISKTAIVRNEPIWYANFIKYVLEKVKIGDFKAVSISEVAKKYKRGNNNLSFLMDDLDQLHKQGLILYYKDDFPERVWFNVQALVKHIYDDILKAQKGINRGYISSDTITKFDDDVIKLLERKNILIHDKNEKKYIIPNFLPLSSESNESFDLLTFDLNKPAFILKFKNFLPFGLMNQIIGHFSNYWSAKSIWREKIIFKFEELYKVLIHIDFVKLEIRVCITSTNTIKERIDEIISYLFYSILASYWELDKLSITAFRTYKANIFKENTDITDLDDYHIDQLRSLYKSESCHPEDLFISFDGINYVNHRKLCGSDSRYTTLYNLDSSGQLMIVNELDQIHKYSTFTLKTTKAPKKVVISYSKSDIQFVQEFQKHVSALHDIGLIESPWYCTLLVAGTKWDETIQEKFNEADIVFFMVSHNLMATSYVKEFEIKKAIDKYKETKRIRIVPIILSDCHWLRPGEYNLGDFTALPYAAEPITSYPNPNEIWTYVVKCIEIMIRNEEMGEDWTLQKFNSMETTVKRVIKNRDNIVVEV